MDKIINYLLLIIIFVFDPLAISLVVAANFAFAQLKNKDENEPNEALKQAFERHKEEVIKEEDLDLDELVLKSQVPKTKPLEVYGETKEKPSIHKPPSSKPPLPPKKKRRGTTPQN